MKFSRPLIFIVAFIIVLVLIKLIFIKKDNGGGPPPTGKPQKVLVTVSVVHKVPLENKVFATGSMISNEEVVLMSEIAGRIDNIFFKEGSHVNKGDLLVKINDADLQAQLKKLNLQVKLAEEMEGRQKKLLAINGISQEDYDISLNQLNTLKADIDLNASAIAKSTIRAPFTGVIGLKNISEGSYISPGVKIASLQQTDPMKIDFSIPEKYANAVHLKDEINFTVPGSDSIFKGTIYAIEPRIDPVSRTLPLRAQTNNKSGMLIPGSFARIELVMSKIPDAIMIPTQALIPELKGQKVFLCKNGKAQPVQVKTGLRTDTQIQVTDGLQSGDSVIVTGFMQLKPGVDLNIKMDQTSSETK